MKHDFLTSVNLYEPRIKQHAMVYLHSASADDFLVLFVPETIPVEELS